MAAGVTTARRAPGHRMGPVAVAYRGLASFPPEYVDWFFRRQVLTDQLLTRLVKLHAAGEGIQVVVGASGSGKFSLLRAGMIPALHGGGVPGSAAWPVVLLTPAACPVDGTVALSRAAPSPCAEVKWRAPQTLGNRNKPSI